ncbi:MAG: DUF4296 domain-containing protein [Longimonas sp.]|uniref:DUF4296 domain-containing protein n=1 Tax=Longimonas sp. TaxID=2039626 RepID=UPI00397720CC
MLCGLLLIAQAGCTDEEPPLDTQTMRAVLVDLHLAESRLNADGVVPRLPRDSILVQHNVAPAEFDSAQAYYTRHPDTYHDIYQEVVDSLRAIRGIADSLRDADSNPEQ